MFIFGHIGLTLGTAIIVENVYAKIGNRFRDKSNTLESLSGNSRRDPVPESSGRRLFDIRFLLLGALLPDIIDKPASLLFNQAFHGNGRLFSHSLLFAVVMLSAGIYMLIFGKQRWLFALAFGVLLHIILDSMWVSPQVFYWPFRGLEFSSFQRVNFVSTVYSRFKGVVRDVYSDPAIYIPELAGMVITAGYTWKLARAKRIKRLLFHGD
jgi:inner membrane protein